MSPAEPPPAARPATARRRGFRRLRLAPLWPPLAALLVMTAMLAWQLPPLLRATAGNQLLDAAPALHRVLEPLVGGDRRVLQERVSALVAGSSLRITVVAPGGRVVADSDRTASEVARMESHARRPEIAAALATGNGTAVRRSDTTQRRYVYAARTFPTAGGGRYVLRLAQPLGELVQVRRQLVGALTASLLVTLLAVGLLSLWLDRRLLRPLARLIDGTGALAAGRRRDHLPIPEQDDLAALAGAVNRLTDRLEVQMQALTGERDHLQEILGSMSEGVLVVDGEGRAVLANPAFRRLFALSPGAVAGRRPLELARQAELADLVAATLATGEARREEVAVDTGQGRRTLSLAGAALGAARAAGEAGGPQARPGAVVVARDTSELARLARMRSDFVANVSHELKTPLTAIRGYSETLRDGALEEPETARRFVDRVLEQARRLELLLDDLLTLSRLESKEAPMERRPVDVARLLERAVETVGPQADRREVTIRREVGDDLPRLAGDARALERLLLNLLDNAVKYNRPGGEVVVRISASSAGDELEISVTDSGIGIPAAAHDRIFERFYRVDKARGRDEGGTGLGLAIVKHVAQSHGGRVAVESRPGEGSTFRVHLPGSPD